MADSDWEDSQAKRTRTESLTPFDEFASSLTFATIKFANATQGQQSSQRRIGALLATIGKVMDDWMDSENELVPKIDLSQSPALPLASQSVLASTSKSKVLMSVPPTPKPKVLMSTQSLMSVPQSPLPSTSKSKVLMSTQSLMSVPQSPLALPPALMSVPQSPLAPPPALMSVPHSPLALPPPPMSNPMSPANLRRYLDRLQDICIVCWVNGDPLHPPSIKLHSQLERNTFFEIRRSIKYTPDIGICFGCGIPQWRVS